MRNNSHSSPCPTIRHHASAPVRYKIQFTFPPNPTIFQRTCSRTRYNLRFPPTHLHASAPGLDSTSSSAQVLLLHLSTHHEIQFAFPPTHLLHARAPVPARERILVSIQHIFFILAHQHEIHFAFPPNPTILDASAQARDTIRIISKSSSFS
jgi:hypothetical protein